MRAWRLALGRYPELDGEGARLYGGRWNSPGNPVTYAASSLSLALLEQLVHLSPERISAAFRAFAIEIPDDIAVETADIEAGDPDGCRGYGDGWLASVRSGVLLVPSVIVPPLLEPGGIRTIEHNVLLNPRHASSRLWRVVETSFRIDPRLRRAAW